MNQDVVPISDRASSPAAVAPRRWRWGITVAVAVVVVTTAAIVTRNSEDPTTRAPKSYHRWWQHHSVNGKSHEVPHYFIATVTDYDTKPYVPTIGYFVRIDDLELLDDPTPWLRIDGGQVFVQEELVARESGTLRLFIDDGRRKPLRVDLDYADVESYFPERAHYFTHFERSDEFWTKVLHADSLLQRSDRQPISVAIELPASDPQ